MKNSFASLLMNFPNDLLVVIKSHGYMCETSLKCQRCVYLNDFFCLVTLH